MKGVSGWMKTRYYQQQSNLGKGTKVDNSARQISIQLGTVTEEWGKRQAGRPQQHAYFSNSNERVTM